MSTFIVGLTGGIGSGKTTITNMFIELGVDVVDADIIARQVVAPKSKALKTIAEHFGDAFIQSNGELNRALLRTQIFSHPQDKRWLNELLHPLIREELLKQLHKATSSYCLLVAPLLIENNLLPLVNRTLVVDVSESVQLARTLLRDTSSETEIKAIIASQTTRADRLSFADDVIDNNTNKLALVNSSVQSLHAKYLTLASAY